MRQPRFVTPYRAATSRKGENGRVLIVGGSEEHVGALALAGLAAARSGADLVTIAAPSTVAWAINALAPDLITIKLSGTALSMRHLPRLRTLAKRADVILFGNGAGQRPGTRALLRALARVPNRKVIDADGIKAVAATGLRDAIITPHRREFEIFLENSRISAADARRVSGPMRTFIERDNLILLKGPTDQILSRDGIDSVSGGNPGLTRGGTGDVLAGLVAGYWTQGLDARQAAINASIMNKRIGDALKRKHKGYTYLASDMVGEIRKMRRSIR